MSVSEAERRQIERLCASPPPRILVASDLHLACGRDPVTGAHDRTENFVVDDAFAEYLDHYRPQAAGTLLILNGDIFDVLRVTRVPTTDDDYLRWSRHLEALGEPRTVAALRDAVTKSEGRYGLQTDDYKTVWKLMLTAAGHPGFFAALASWVSDGGTLLFVTGNHDVELYWPLVREAIRHELHAGGAAADRVLFEHESIVIDNLYVEHGHQYDDMTRVEGAPTLAPDHTQINLPLGSFVNRYFINRIEALDPFIDNVKPVQRSLLKLARQRPLRMVGTYFGAWRFLRRAIAKRQVNRSVLLIALALALPILSPVVLLVIPGVRDAVLGWLPFGATGRAIVALASGVVLSGALPYLAGAVNEVLRRRPKPDRHLEAARRIVRSKLADSGRSRAYVCMGHTHVNAVKRIDDVGHQLYLNTGTWIALWPDDRPDLLGRKVLTYALFETTAADGYRATALEWDAHAGHPRPASILDPGGG